jgi:hypothetical protein
MFEKKKDDFVIDLNSHYKWDTSGQERFRIVTSYFTELFKI